VDRQKLIHSQTITPDKVWPYEVDVRRRLLVAVLLLVSICLASIGVSLLVRGLYDYTIDAWRLVLLFANVFGCATVVCALLARGRASVHRRNIGRRKR
jgi:hypothetical protein